MHFAARNCVQLRNVALGEKDAIAPVELRIAQSQPASRQLSDPIEENAAANPLNDRANAASAARSFIGYHQLTSLLARRCARRRLLSPRLPFRPRSGLWLAGS